MNDQRTNLRKFMLEKQFFLRKLLEVNKSKPTSMLYDSSSQYVDIICLLVPIDSSSVSGSVTSKHVVCTFFTKFIFLFFSLSSSKHVMCTFFSKIIFLLFSPSSSVLKFTTCSTTTAKR